MSDDRVPRVAVAIFGGFVAYALAHTALAVLFLPFDALAFWLQAAPVRTLASIYQPIDLAAAMGSAFWLDIVGAYTFATLVVTLGAGEAGWLLDGAEVAQG